MSAVRVQIAFFTGRSNPASCALSPIQTAFLERLRRPGRQLEPLNFPYRPAAMPYESVGLIRASINNALDYLGSRRGAFRERYRPAVEALLSRAPHTVLLMGSCGLELFVNLALDAHCLERTTVFAFGPVARSLPPCRCVLVQGRRDWISRVFVDRADHLIEGHHLDYLLQEEVLECCESLVDEVVSAERETARGMP
jgi:hypothetical protein